MVEARKLLDPSSLEGLNGLVDQLDRIHGK
jgi:hypothetical protein